MRNKFKLYYQYANEDKISDAIKNGTIFLDTNVLLHFYRLGRDFSDTFFKVLEKVKDRVFIPYQVAKEYHSNYWEVIIGEKKNYEKVHDYLKGAKDVFSLLFSGEKSLEPPRCIDKDFQKETNSDFESVVKKIIDKCEEEYALLTHETSNRELFEKIASFFEGKVLEGFSSEELLNIKCEGEKRYEGKIPPGYKDGKKDDNKYGDFIIWREILRYAEQHKDSDIVFVTDDHKEDWINTVRGESHGPRMELRYEFSQKSDSKFYLIKPLWFIENVVKAYAIEDAKAQLDAFEPALEKLQCQNVDEVKAPIGKIIAKGKHEISAANEDAFFEDEEIEDESDENLKGI